MRVRNEVGLYAFSNRRPPEAGLLNHLTRTLKALSQVRAPVHDVGVANHLLQNPLTHVVLVDVGDEVALDERDEGFQVLLFRDELPTVPVRRVIPNRVKGEQHIVHANESRGVANVEEPGALVL